MIVRLKKRGEWPHNTHPILNIFRGCCFEVEPAESYSDDACSCVDTTQYRLQTGCGARIFVITDGRYLALRPHDPPSPSDPYGLVHCICEHHLIDDINAFDSDFCDEEAKEGDLAFAQIPVTVQR